MVNNPYTKTRSKNYEYGVKGPGLLPLVLLMMDSFDGILILFKSVYNILRYVSCQWCGRWSRITLFIGTILPLSLSSYLKTETSVFLWFFF